MKISEMSRDEKREYLEKAYDAAVQAYAAGELPGKHPSHQMIAWSKLREGNPDQIEDNSLSEADPSAPGGNRAHGRKALDGHYQLGMDSVPRFFKSDGTVIVGDKALELRARQYGDTTAMHRMIPGYGRIR